MTMITTKTVLVTLAAVVGVGIIANAYRPETAAGSACWGVQTGSPGA